VQQGNFSQDQEKDLPECMLQGAKRRRNWSTGGTAWQALGTSDKVMPSQGYHENCPAAAGQLLLMRLNNEWQRDGGYGVPDGVGPCTLDPAYNPAVLSR